MLTSSGLCEWPCLQLRERILTFSWFAPKIECRELPSIKNKFIHKQRGGTPKILQSGIAHSTPQRKRRKRQERRFNLPFNLTFHQYNLSEIFNSIKMPLCVIYTGLSIYPHQRYLDCCDSQNKLHNWPTPTHFRVELKLRVSLDSPCMYVDVRKDCR